MKKLVLSVLAFFVALGCVFFVACGGGEERAATPTSPPEGPAQAAITPGLAAAIATATATAEAQKPTPTEVKPTSTPESTPTPEKPSFTFEPDGVYTGALENGGTIIIFASSNRNIGVIVHKQNIPCTGPLSSTEILHPSYNLKREFDFSTSEAKGVLISPTNIKGQLTLKGFSTNVQGQTLTCEGNQSPFEAVLRGRGEDVLIDEYLEIFKKTKQFFAPSTRDAAKQTLTNWWRVPIFSE